MQLIQPEVIVALGRIAFERVLRINNLSPSALRFAHAALYRLDAGVPDTSFWLLASYHPSQQNTLTGKLTVEMFDAIWWRVRELLDK
jgi:uracil-DNA glycosylase